MTVVTVARKPLGAGTVASNVLVHHTGALNVDASRIRVAGAHSPDAEGGRWPANLTLEHGIGCRQVGDGEWRCTPGCTVADLDTQTGDLRARGNTTPTKRGEPVATSFMAGGESAAFAGDAGGASRFFKQVGGRR